MGLKPRPRKSSSSYDMDLALRARQALGQRPIVDKEMFGGIAFMVRGNMCVGVVGDRLVARVGAEQYDVALAKRHAAPMDFTGRRMRGWVFVNSGGTRTDSELRAWVQRCTKFVDSLPAK